MVSKYGSLSLHSKWHYRDNQRSMGSKKQDFSGFLLIIIQVLKFAVLTTWLCVANVNLTQDIDFMFRDF